MNDRIAEWLVKYRILLAVLGFFSVITMGYGVSKLYMNTSYKVFYADDNPNRMARDFIKATYASSDNFMFVVAPKDEQIFSRSTLASIEDLTERSWTLPYSIRVDSITNFQHTYAEGDELVVQSLVDDALNMSDEAISNARSVALSNKQLVNKMLSNKAHVTAVNVQLNIPEDSDEHPQAEGGAIRELVAAGRKLSAEIEANNPNLELHLLGNAVVNTTFTETARHDLKTLLPMLFAVMMILLVLMLRSVWSAVITVVIIAMSILSTQGVMGWVGLAVNQVSSMTPIIILSLAVCDCVHLLSSYLTNLGFGKTRIDAMTDALKINLNPIFLTALTTAIGFMALNTSDVPPFRDMGNVSAFGVVMAFIFTILVVPMLAIALPMKAKTNTDNAPIWTEALAGFVIKQHNKLFGWGLVLVIGVASLSSLNELNDGVLEYFDDSLPFRQSADFTEQNLTGFHEVQYSLDSGVSGGVNEPYFLKKVEAFSEWYDSQPESVHVTSYIDVIRRLNKNMHGDDPSWKKLPDDRALASQYQLLYELSLPYGLDLNNQVDMDKRSLLFKVTLKSVSSREIIEIEERAQVWLKQNWPEVKTRGAGMSIMFSHLGMENINSMLSGSVVAIVLITLTLMVVLRSIKLGLLSLLPNVFPAAIVFGAWGFFVGKMDLGVAVIFSLTLGIVVDDTVHFLSKYLRARRLHGDSAEQAVLYAFKSVGKALLVTTLTLAAGFYMLAFSNFVVNANMGIMVAATILVALLLDFFFLPSLLIKIDSKSEQISATCSNVDRADIVRKNTITEEVNHKSS